MFWKRRDGHASTELQCEVEGCDFICHDMLTLQKHTFKKHPGLQLRCKVEGCDFTCTEFMTMEKHMAWKHPQAKEASPSAKS
ncbi:MAG TPA: hypothetical protein G4O10_03140 [Dehalococcoidia bacterium]|nr:hypothetical protein [Dehalococcoidia bacterium]